MSILSVTPFLINFNYGIDCGAGQYRSGGSTYTTQVQKLENINSYLAELILQGGSADQFELQATATSKLNYFLMDTLPESIDSVIKILTDNPGQMEDADIQLIFACIQKRDFVNASNYTDALAANRDDWQALFYKLIDIYQELEGILSVNATNTEYLNFMTELANVEGKDGCEIARAILKFSMDVDFEVPRPYPGEGEGARQMAPGSGEIIPALIADEIVRIFPNPANTMVTVQYISKTPGDASLEVRDILGKIVYNGQITNGNNLDVTLKEYSNGIYIISILKDRTLLYNTKLIKQD